MRRELSRLLYVELFETYLVVILPFLEIGIKKNGDGEKVKPFGNRELGV